MTWKQFKDQVEAQGVKDDTEIKWIDTASFDAEVDFEEDGRVTIC